MLDLQAQPRTGGVTRGAPDKGDVGSDSPLGREAGPRSVPPPLPPPPTPPTPDRRRARWLPHPRPPQTPGSPQGPVLGSWTPHVEKCN